MLKSRPCPRSIKSETLGVDLVISIFVKLLSILFLMKFKFKNIRVSHNIRHKMDAQKAFIVLRGV